MAWDPSLLRKYNITSHFRLLNQVRSELKDQPLQRPVAGTRAEATARRAARSSESSRRGRSGGAAPSRSVAAAPVATSTSTPENSFDPIVMVPVITDAFDSQH